MYGKITPFSEIDGNAHFQDLQRSIIGEIDTNLSSHKIPLDEELYIKGLIDKYTLKPIELDEITRLDPPSSDTQFMKDHGTNIHVEVYIFTIKYKYKGDPILFRIVPGHFCNTIGEIIIDTERKIISFEVSVPKSKIYPELVSKEKSNYFKNVFYHLEGVNKFATNWNNSLAEFVTSQYQSIKDKYQKEREFFEAMNISVSGELSFICDPEIIEKQKIPEIEFLDVEEKHIPMISNTIYQDILKVIHLGGKNIEKKPSLYIDKDEEGLRDLFVFLLETRYKGVGANAEAFNKKGKTDILLKYVDTGDNVFIAECKIWHGQSQMNETISQMFDNYLTVRDTKTALLLFVQNKGFTEVLEEIKKNAVNHPNYKRTIQVINDSSFSYIFSLPQDDKQDVFLEIMAFHYNETELKQN